MPIDNRPKPARPPKNPAFPVACKAASPGTADRSPASLDVARRRPLTERATLAQQVVESLWPHHFFKALGLHRSSHDLTQGGAAGVIDLLLHARDRAYTVDQVHDLLAGAGARLLTFSRPLLYRPDGYPMTDTMRRQMTTLDERGRQGVCEPLNGRLAKHEFFATRAGFVPDVLRPVRPPARCGRWSRRLLVREGVRPSTTELADAWARLFAALEAVAYAGLGWARQ